MSWEKLEIEEKDFIKHTEHIIQITGTDGHVIGLTNCGNIFYYYKFSESWKKLKLPTELND